MNVKPIDQVVDKWKRRVAVAGPDYEYGIKNPKRPWAASAIAAEDLQAEGSRRAIDDKMYVKGIKRVGDEKWREMAEKKGPNRFREGVNLAEPYYREGVEPYLNALSRLELPGPWPKGDPRNITERVGLIASTLHELKVSGA
ncbi:hypothetical protein ES705_48714 [subsurface metagenome]